MPGMTVTNGYSLLSLSLSLSQCLLFSFTGTDTDLTAEPGYYEDGAFGIRIESVLIVKEVDTPHRFGGVPYYGFEHITFVSLFLDQPTPLAVLLFFLL
jgi:hypothetical protein